MDKQNYTLREFEMQVLKENCALLKGKLTKELEDRILKRKRVLKSLELLIKAIFLYLTEQLSFQRLSDRMACLYHVVMSDTAWRKQFLKAAPILVEWVLAQQGRTEPEDSGGTVLGCTDVYAVDATDLPVQGGDATSRRVHTVFSICERRCVCTDITDRHGGESLTRFPLRPGALYFADRAYGRTPQLAYAMEQKAHVVTRIAPNQVAFYTAPDCREKISFPSLLNGEAFSTVAYFKWKQKVYRIRLLGAKLPEEKREATEKRLRRKANRNQRRLSEDTVRYAGWVFLGTTLPDACTDAEILEAYRLRWQIELHFKRIKSLLNFHKIRRSSDIYKNGIVSLWLTISFLISCVQLWVLHLTNFSISDFNAFSLAKGYFA